MAKLAGRIALVTGGARGIGAAIAHRLSADGARVAILDVLEEQGRAVAEAVHGVFVRCDMATPESVRGAVRSIEHTLGGLDVVVSNAGIDIVGPFASSDPASWEPVLDVNLRGPLHLCHAALPLLVRRGTGRVILVSSDAARVGSSGEAVYAACKAGLIALAKTLAREHARDGITVNAVCPGPTDTQLLHGLMGSSEEGKRILDAVVRQIPLRRLARPEEIANAVAFLAGDESAYITGQTLSVSGGLTMA
ncbi:MAG TPA: SDR family NAD(P)-dependent oxidoreductase [Myxococcota bacterium]|nr:SDR family NAD(P)-dependent oxidoreductase [Myxococcota bacterium]